VEFSARFLLLHNHRPLRHIEPKRAPNHLIGKHILCNRAGSQDICNNGHELTMQPLKYLYQRKKFRSGETEASPDNAVDRVQQWTAICTAGLIIDRKRVALAPDRPDALRDKVGVATTEKRPSMKYLHTMVRVSDVDKSLDFYCNKLGLKEVRRMDNPQGRFTLIFLAAPGDEDAQIELTHNWDPEAYGEGRNFGHLAYEVDDIYAACNRLMKNGVVINRPPRDGHMAFIRSPDNISIELLQKGKPKPKQEPWASMPNTGKW
jgi:lactoylglutathione lyase